MPGPQDLTGTLVDGRYRVDGPIGYGGSGTVYAAQHLGLATRVALKVLDVDWSASVVDRSARAEQFLAEAKILQPLRHPHIVSVLGAGFIRDDHGDTPYIALAWSGGSTLAAVLAASRGQPPRSPAEAWALLEPIVEAVAHAHMHRVTHCDLTPSNVMMDDSGGVRSPRVIDFGIAQLVERDAGAQHPRRRAFTLDYASPEQIIGRPTSPRTDVHGLGLLFLEVLSNRLPYGAEEPGLAAIDPVRPSANRLGADAGPFAAALGCALSLDPDDRFSDARALARALGEAARSLASMTTGSGVVLGSVPAVSPAMSPPGRFRRRLAIAALAGVPLLAAGGFGMRAMQRPPTPLADLSIEDAAARLRRDGFTVEAFGNGADIKTITVALPEGGLVALSIHPMTICEQSTARRCATRIRDAVIRLSANARGEHHHAVVYAADTRATLVVMAVELALGRRVRDTVIAGLDVDVVGELPREARPSGDGTSTNKLSSMGPDQLATHLQRAGQTVTWSGEGKDGIVAMAAYQSGAVGSATLYRGNVAAIVDSIAKQSEPFAWASSGDVLLVLRGQGNTATRPTLIAVIRGTDGVVGGSRP